MTDLRTAAQQALEALRCVDLQSLVPDYGSGHYSVARLDGPQVKSAITAMEAALAEPTVKESLQVESAFAENATTQQQLEEAPPSDYRRGYWNGYWNGFEIGKREGRIEAENALAEPVQEPAPMPPFPPVSLWKRGCAVCGLGADGKAYGYACPRSDCPTRVTCGGAV